MDLIPDRVPGGMHAAAAAAFPATDVEAIAPEPFATLLRRLHALRIGALRAAGIWAGLPETEVSHHYRRFRSNPAGYLQDAPDSEISRALWRLISAPEPPDYAVAVTRAAWGQS